MTNPERLEPVDQAIRLIDEINKRASSRQFYGISQGLHSKLCTIRATLARHRLSTQPTDDKLAAAVSALVPFAEQRTIDEILHGNDEWAGASAQQRVRLLGERKRKRDADILRAREVLAKLRSE